MRFLRLVVVCLLVFSASGATELISFDDCSPTEATSSEHRTCAPNCVRCSCCTQAIAIQTIAADVSVFVVVGESVEQISALPAIVVGEILHVPKLHI